MSEPIVAQPQGGPAGASSPGAMLRAAREKQGLHIAALAAAIKVAPRKLDALENDRWQDLPDATFVRALAQTVCRTLKVDPRPILERLPRADTAILEHVGGSLNMPFDDAGQRADGLFSRLSLRPLVLASAVLMLAALVLTFAPIPWGDEDELSTPQPVVMTPSAGSEPEAQAGAAGAEAADAAVGDDTATPGAAATDGSAPAAAVPSLATPLAAATGAPPVSSPMPPTVAPTVPPPAAPSAVAPAAAPAAPTATTGILRIRTTDASWIEVRDADNRVLLSRVVAPGEALGLDGAAPLRVVVGNATATELQFRGQPLDMASLTRDNVVRVTLR